MLGYHNQTGRRRVSRSNEARVGIGPLLDGK